MESMGRGEIAAIIMADVVGYSRFMGQDEASTVRTLKAHRAFFTRHIQNLREIGAEIM